VRLGPRRDPHLTRGGRFEPPPQPWHRGSGGFGNRSQPNGKWP
jgi:hypothetical protein